MRRQLTGIALGMVAALLAANIAQAQATSRVRGFVKDVDGNPIEGVTITVTSPAHSEYEITKVTNKKGRFLITHADATMGFVYKLEKEGYETLTEQVRPPAGALLEKDFTMRPGRSGGHGAGAPLTGTGRAIMAYNEGAKAQQAGDLALAEERFRQAAELDPKLVHAYTAMSVLAYQRGDYAEAAAQAERALAVDPANSQALQLRYDSYRLAGDDAQAQQALAALQASGGASDAAVRIYNEGVEAFTAGDTEAAVAKFSQAIAVDPEFVAGYSVLARIYLAQNRNADAAAMADEALAREPGNVEALKVRYDAARRLGKAEEASSALEALVAADPAWATTGLFNHAVELYNDGDMAGAEGAFRQVLEADPDHPRANYLLGMALYNLGNTEAARQHLERFLELAPEDPEADIAREVLKYL